MNGTPEHLTDENTQYWFFGYCVKFCIVEKLFLIWRDFNSSKLEHLLISFVKEAFSFDSETIWFGKYLAKKGVFSFRSNHMIIMNYDPANIFPENQCFVVLLHRFALSFEIVTVEQFILSSEHNLERHMREWDPK